jgi:hypothetical protein
MQMPQITEASEWLVAFVKDKGGVLTVKDSVDVVG